MTWREELLPASFRGVPFEVEGDSGSFGRRVQVHEYPQRDKPWTEDLGRATRAFEITAFLIGPDYLQQRDDFIAALETEGPGLLVHPWYGELTVNVKDLARVTHSRLNGGMCEISLSFVEAGELEFPAAADSLGAQALVAADELAEISILDFAGISLDGLPSIPSLPSFSLPGLPSFSLDGLPSFGLDSLLSDIDVFDGLLEAASGGLDFVKGLVPAWPLEALSLAGTVLSGFDRARLFASSVMGMFNRTVLPVEVVGSARLNRNAVINLTALSRQYGGYVIAPTSAAPATRQVQANRAAVAQLYQRATLVQAAGMAAAMPLPVYDDAVLVRESVAAAIEESTFEASDAVYVKLQVLRSRVHTDITGRMAQSARLLDYTPRLVMPGLALAYELHEDPSREVELVERNGLRHPGFMPARALRVLSA